MENDGCLHLITLAPYLRGYYRCDGAHGAHWCLRGVDPADISLIVNDGLDMRWNSLRQSAHWLERVAQREGLARGGVLELADIVRLCADVCRMSGMSRCASNYTRFTVVISPAHGGISVYRPHGVPIAIFATCVYLRGQFRVDPTG